MDATLEVSHTGPEHLLLVGTFPGRTPRALFSAWTEPAQLCRWWPTQAEIEPRVGGAYRLDWPRQGWTLRGRYTTFDPGNQLGFTWRWDHDPAEGITTTVKLNFAPLGESASQLRLTHGPYTVAGADQEQRASHLDGWRHFLARLQALPPA
jgi:uncharacterized protein YndB with AHSA1/START domain